MKEAATMSSEVTEAHPDREAFRHKMAPDGRESLAHVMVLPDLGLAGFIYPTVRADGLAKGRCRFFGPGLPEPVEEEFEEFVPSDMDFDAWRAARVDMSIIEPHRIVDLAFRGDRIRFEGRFTALHPVYSFNARPNGIPAFYGDNRTEQQGRIEAVLEVDGKRFDIDGGMARDHSWGSRVWGLNQHYKWVHVVTGETCLHLFELQSFGRLDTRGYLYRDGKLAHLVSADYDYEFNDEMLQTKFGGTFTDSLGRSARMTGEAFVNYCYPLDPEIYLNYGMMAAEIDGSKGSAWVEFCWNRSYYDFAKDYAKRFGNL